MKASDALYWIFQFAKLPKAIPKEQKSRCHSTQSLHTQKHSLLSQVIVGTQAQNNWFRFYDKACTCSAQLVVSSMTAF